MHSLEHTREALGVLQFPVAAVPGHALHPGEVAARAERRAAPGQHQHPHGVVLLQFGKGLGKFADQNLVECVAHVRAVIQTVATAPCRSIAIQHPLARSWMELEAAHLMVQKAAWLYDRDLPCAAEANSAKFLAAEACYGACENAILTHGGMGYAKEYHVERYLRESWIPRLAPVSPQQSSRMPV